MKKFKFEHFERVVARETKGSKWCCDFYSHYDADRNYPYVCVGGYYEECVPYEGNAHLVNTTDAYVEPFHPENGDFIAMIGEFNGGKATWICICKEYKDNEIYYHAGLDAYHRLLGKEKTHYDFNPKRERDGEIRLATEEEKQLLLSKLHEIGKNWDAEKKEVVDWKWEPNDGEEYYAPFFNRCKGGFVVVQFVCKDDTNDIYNKENGWVFRTEAECQAMCEKLNQAIKNVK